MISESLTTPAPAHPSSSFLADMGAAMRRSLILWILYVIVFGITWIGIQWGALGWTILNLVRVTLATAVVVSVVSPKKPLRHALRDSLIALLLLGAVNLPGVIQLLLTPKDVPPGTIYWWLFTSLISLLFNVAVGVFIVATTQTTLHRWLLIAASSFLYLPQWYTLAARFLPRSVEHDWKYVYLTSLLVTVPAGVLALLLWKPLPSTSASGASQRINNLTAEILVKEFRLQKNNLYFTLATLLLGILGFVTLSAAEPNAASFNPEDIRSALFSIVLIPLLVIVLPIMIGSTSAAAEKPMGVHAWQAALPVGLLRITAFKLVVILFLVTIVSGFLPVILETIASPTLKLKAIFRETWPGWLGYLFAAIGFYSGTWARDDYQGLLVSIIPISILGLVMFYADPLLLVSPVLAMRGALHKEYLLGARLLLMAAAFVAAAIALQRTRSQRRTRQIALHGLSIALLAFALTLTHIVLERKELKAAEIPQTEIIQPYSPIFGSAPTAVPIPIASATYSTIDLLAEMKTLPPGIVAGSVGGGSHGTTSQGNVLKGHYFLVLPNKAVREFPQSIPMAKGLFCSAHGRWLLVSTDERIQLLCGPLGISIYKPWVPDWFFRVMLNVAGIKPTAGFSDYIEADSASNTTKVLPGGDLQVPLHAQTDILIKNGANLIANASAREFSTRWLPAEWNSGGGLVLNAHPANDNATTQVAVLEPTTQAGTYNIKGWAAPTLHSVTTDHKWITFGPDWRNITVRQLTPPDNPEAALTGEGLKEFKLSAVRPQPDDTTITLTGSQKQLEVFTLADTPYLVWPYEQRGPVTIGSNLTRPDMWLGAGVLLLNLETGKEKLVLFEFPWSPHLSALLLEKYRHNTSSETTSSTPTGDEPGLKTRQFDDGYLTHLNAVVHPDGLIAAEYTDMLLIVDLMYWPSTRVPEVARRAARIPGDNIVDLAFLDRNTIIANNGQTLYYIEGPRKGRN